MRVFAVYCSGLSKSLLVFAATDKSAETKAINYFANNYDVWPDVDVVEIDDEITELRDIF